MSDLAYSNLGYGPNVESGIAEFVLLAQVSWFASGGIQAPVAPFTNPGDSVTITTPHVFNPAPGSNGALTSTITAPGTVYANGTYLNVPLVNITGTGNGALATVVVAGAVVASVAITTPGQGYTVADTFGFAAMFDAVGAGSGFVGAVATVSALVNYKFTKFQLAPQKNKLDMKTIGELGLNKQQTEVEIFIPGSYAIAHEKVRNLLNTQLIVLVKDSNCPANLFYQLGCDCQFAWLTGDFSTGTTKDGVKGYTTKLQYDSGIQIYNPLSTGVSVPVDVLAG